MGEEEYLSDRFPLADLARPRRLEPFREVHGKSGLQRGVQIWMALSR